MPQSMQRAPCCASVSFAYGRYTSRQSLTRSVTGRDGCFLRAISMNPVGLPTGGTHEIVEIGVEALLTRGVLGLQHALVVARYDLHPLPANLGPAEEQLGGARAAGERDVARDEPPEQRFVVVVD